MSRIDSATIAKPQRTVRSLFAQTMIDRTRSGRRLTVVWTLMVVLVGGLLCNQRVFSQDAGVLPPRNIARPNIARPGAPSADEGGLRIEAFMFLDRQNNPVLMPGMTYEQLKELESKAASQSQNQRYIWRRVRIDGNVDDRQAELTVEMRLKVEATGNETISIPLELSNFHRRSPPEFVEGASDKNSLAISVDPDSGGYVLLASIEEPTEVAIRMKMLARVESDSAQSLECRLPLAPVSMLIQSDRRDSTAEIIGRGDEVIETRQNAQGRSEFLVESGGGTLTLRWGTRDRRTIVPVLETNSTISMQWKTPQEQLIQKVLLTVRDSRGAVTGFRLILPPGGRFYKEDPKLSANGQYVQWKRPDPQNKELFEITIPPQERGQRIDLELSVQVPSEGVTESNPLSFQIPRVESALREVGEIKIETGSDYRLRWRENPYVQNTTLPSLAEGGVDSRSYDFEFNRGSFTLPIWLGETKRRLDVSSECDLELHDDYATLAMQIQSTGSSSRTQLLSVDLAGWEIPQITDATTNAPLPWYRTGELVEIEMPVIGMEEIAPIRIRAQRMIASSDDPAPLEIDLPLPRVVGSGDRQNPITIQESVVRTISRGRRAMVVDLERSLHLERDQSESNSAVMANSPLRQAMDSPDLRVTDPLSTTGQSSLTARQRQFKVMPPNAEARLVGALLDQPPRLALEKSVQVQLMGEKVETTVLWKLDSQTDLRGRLSVKIPAEMGSDDTGQWTALVNGEDAQLRLLPSEQVDGEMANGEPLVDDPERRTIRRGTQAGDWRTRLYDLVADGLSDRPMVIRFRHSSPIRFVEGLASTTVLLPVPLPAVDDITLTKPVSFQLMGDASRDLIALDRSSGDRFELSSLPTDPLSMRISPRSKVVSELQIENVVVRTAISESVQHDQIIASVVGSGEFQLRLQDPNETDLQVTVDDAPASLTRIGKRLLIALNDNSSMDDEDETKPANRHVIDVRLWNEIDNGALLSETRPLAEVGPGAQELHWFVTMPTNRHLVWSPASANRVMQWVFDRWRLVRRPMSTEAVLISGIADVETSPMPLGNQYLFSAMDGSSFHAKTGTRTLLWLVVASMLVLPTALLTYLPIARNPVSFVLALVAFAGLLLVAPDAAIIVGQIGMLGIVVVVVMLAVRVLMMPTGSRVLSSTTSERMDGASKLDSRAEARPASSISITRSVTPEKLDASPSEVAS